MAAFREFREGTDRRGLWQPRAAWPGVKARRSLRTFLGEEDQVDAVRRWFLERLDEVRKFKTDKSELPWGAGSETGQEEDEGGDP